MTTSSQRRRSLVLGICCTSMIIVVMDISIVNTALPVIQRELDASVTSLQWIVDAYTLVLASFLLLAGSTSDRFGRKRIFQTGLAAFGLGSLLCGLAPDTGWLIAARAVQAIGGTMLNPVAMAIIANVFTVPAERARAIGVFSSMSGLSLALGPVLGGLLVDTFGWRSIFLINIPIVLAAIGLTARFIPESRAPRARRFDPVGQLLVIVVLGSVVYAIIDSHSAGWTSPSILLLLTVAVLGVTGLIGYELRRTDPLLELRLFRSVPFSSAILMAVLAMCAFGAFMFVTPLYLQNVRGMSALTAGLGLLPLGGLIAILAPYVGKLVGARGARPALLISSIGLILGAALSFPLVKPTTPLVAVLAVYLLFGVFLGTISPPITNTAVSGMPRSMAGVATSLASAARQTGTTLGVAIAGTIAGSTHDAAAFTEAEHGVWWLMLALGTGILVLGLLSTGSWATSTAERAATLFDETDQGPSAPAAAAR